MKAIRTYPTRLEADIARIALEAENIEAVVVGVGITMEGGMASVQLLVPDEHVAKAEAILAEM